MAKLEIACTCSEIQGTKREGCEKDLDTKNPGAQLRGQEAASQ